jgi:hypothetical protein
MKVGIMQPYFFPYIGYFQLISAADQWVVFDTPQYIRHGWINRNRILHPQAGPKYIILPLEHHPRDAAIRDLRTHPDIDWKTRVMAQVSDYYGKQAPHARAVLELLDEALDERERDLTAVLVKSLGAVCAYLDIPFHARLASTIEFDREQVEHAGQWALWLTQAVGGTHYINPASGQSLFEPSEFAALSIELSFLETGPLKYPQGKSVFQENLSIIDVLMWNSREEVRDMLDSFQLVEEAA